MTLGHQLPALMAQAARELFEFHGAGLVGGVQSTSARPALEPEPHVIPPIFVVLADGTWLAAHEWAAAAYPIRCSTVTTCQVNGHAARREYATGPMRGRDLVAGACHGPHAMSGAERQPDRRTHR